MSEYTLEDINAIVAAVRAAEGGSSKRKGRRFKRSASTPEETELRKKANDEECIRKFTALGHKDVKPRINVLTFKKWVEKGRQVRKNEKGTQVGPFNLFHEDQTDPITATPASVGAVTAPAPASAEEHPLGPLAALGETKAEVKAEAPKTEAAKTSASWTEWNS